MKLLPKIIFAVYLLILIKLILFKGPVFYQVVPTSKVYIEKVSESELVAVNLRPFHTIKGYFNADTPASVLFFNVIGNILLFVPYGFLLPLIFQKRVIFFDVFYSAFLLSVSFELFQLITRTGQFDIDDIILNTTGGMLGYPLLRLLEIGVEKKKIQ
jgi:glycopeptide antibiotics resistance protein